jgi:thymidylate kinase
VTGKLIIIEGVDGTGKSTLIEGLKKRIVPDFIFNYKYPEEPTAEECGAFAKGEYMASIRIFKELLARDKIIVCDRFHLGEYAYGPVMRNYPKWFAEKILEDIENELIRGIGLENVYLIILIVEDAKNALRRMKVKGEYLTKLKEVSDVNNRYKNAFSRTALHTFWATTDRVFEGHPEILLDWVVRFIIENSRRRRKRNVPI